MASLVPSLPSSQPLSGGEREREREESVCMYVCGAQKQSSLAPPRVKRTQNRTEQKASEVKRRERRTREKERANEERKEGTERTEEGASERANPTEW